MFWRQLAAMRAEPFAAVPDAALLDRYTTDRDEAAFEELARRHGGMVWAVCRQLLADPADAEDAFQAVFLAFVKSSGRVRNGNVGAWLHGTAVRGAMKIRRGAVRARQRDRATARPEATVPPADWNELLTAVHEEVGRLPEALRTAFVVCDLEGVPQPDAATRLGWKAGTLTGRLSKARKRLLDALTKRGLAPAATLGLLGLSAATTSADVPLKLLVTVLNFPSAAPGTIPATLAALALEIVPMTLSKVKLLALAAILTCGLAAGTGTVLVQVADAQGPGAMPPGGAAPSATPPLATPTADPKPAAVAEVEYKYIPRRVSKDVVAYEKIVAVINKQSVGGWEYAGTFNAGLTEKVYEDLLGYPGSEHASNTGIVDCTVMVFKKQLLTAKQALVTTTGNKSKETFAAEELVMAALMVNPITNPALCTTAFTVTEAPESGVTVTYTYRPGEVVAPRHLRYAGNNVTAPNKITNLPLQALTRTPPHSQDRPKPQPAPSPSALHRIDPILQPSVTLPTPTVFNGQEYDSICTKSFSVGENNRGTMMYIYYEPGDLVRPSDAGLAEKLGGQVVSMMRQRLLNASGGYMPEAVPATRAAPSTPMPTPAVLLPVAAHTSEPVVLELKVLSAQEVVSLCQEVSPKSVKVMALQQNNSIVVLNATPTDVARLKKLLNVIDVPGKNLSVVLDYSPDGTPTGNHPVVPQPSNPGDRLFPSDSPPLPAPRIEAQPLPAPSLMPAKKPKTKPAEPANNPPPASR